MAQRHQEIGKCVRTGRMKVSGQHFRAYHCGIALYQLAKLLTPEIFQKKKNSEHALLRTFAALSRAALRDGHAELSFTMTVWIGLVTARNNHYVGNLLLELRPKSLEKIPKVIIFQLYGTKR